MLNFARPAHITRITYTFLYVAALILASPNGRYADILERFNVRSEASWVLNWMLTQCFEYKKNSDVNDIYEYQPCIDLPLCSIFV